MKKSQVSEAAKPSGTDPNGSRVTALICAAVLLLAVLLVTFLFLYPRLRAVRELKVLRAALAGDVSELRVTDPRTGREALLTGSDVVPMLEKLRADADAAKYAGKSDAESGNWDTRLAAVLPDGKQIRLYLTADSGMYFTRGITQFRFRLPDGELYDLCCAALN